MAKLTIEFEHDSLPELEITGLDRNDIERVLAEFSKNPPAYNPKYRRPIIDYENQKITDASDLPSVNPSGSPMFFWPTDHKYVTQPFGVNPHDYERFGLPGHEGLDIQAPTGNNVYACYSGKVVSYGWQHQGERDHPYGKHIRLSHNIEGIDYTTIYAHLLRVNVKRGDSVTKGQTIGSSDNTGNSRGAHLHLTVKKKGATAAGLTTFPNDMIDPAPFLGLE